MEGLTHRLATISGHQRLHRCFVGLGSFHVFQWFWLLCSDFGPRTPETTLPWQSSSPVARVLGALQSAVNLPLLWPGQIESVSCKWKHETAEQCDCSTAAVIVLPSNRKTRVVIALKHTAWTSSWPCLCLIQILLGFSSVLHLMNNVEIGHRAQKKSSLRSAGAWKKRVCPILELIGSSCPWGCVFHLWVGLQSWKPPFQAGNPSTACLHFPLRPAQVFSSCCLQSVYTWYKAKLVIPDVGWSCRTHSTFPDCLSASSANGAQAHALAFPSQK